MPKGNSIWIGAGIVLAAGAGFFANSLLRPAAAPAAAASAPAGTPGASGPPAVAVEVTAASRMPLPRGVTAVGSLRSDESVTVRPEVAGRIAQIGFKEGERVAKGQLLFKLDDSVARAEFEQARANHVLARSKYQRALDLERQNFISAQARDEAEGNMKVQQAAADLAQAKLVKTEIRSPLHGMVGLRQVSVGDYVKEGQDLVQLEQIDPLKVDFRIPEVFLTQTRVGQSLQITLDAMPGKQYEGVVYAISPLIDAGGRAVVLRAKVKNAGAQLRPGMFARVRLLLNQQADGIVVPETALVPQGEEQFVFRVVQGRAVRTKVDVGLRSDGKVEVLNGLAEGDQVVTAGQLKLRDGAAVRVVGGAAAGVVPAMPASQAKS